MRPPRIHVSDIPYHVFARGNNRQLIFHDDDDRLVYLRMLEKAHRRFDFVLYSYALMGNHFHLLLQMLRDSTLSALMHWLQLGYARYYNETYARVGHVFQARYHAPLVDKDSYFLTVDRYIHLNPVRAGLAAMPEDYRWSSYRSRFGGKSDVTLDHETVLAYYGKDPIARKLAYQRFTEEGIGKREEWSLDVLAKTVAHGSAEFLQKARARDQKMRYIA